MALTPQQLAELQRLRQMFLPLAEQARRDQQRAWNAEQNAQQNAPGKAKGGSVPSMDVMRLAIGGQSGSRNWLKSSVENVLKPLKSKYKIEDAEEDLRNMRKQYGELPAYAKADKDIAHQKALNNWVDRNLANYIKKQMATHDDPIRKLAEQGIVHMPPEQMGYGSSQAEAVRKKHGAPRLGQSPEAQAWEDATDVSMHPYTVADVKKAVSSGGPHNPEWLEPWMEKADPSTKVYSALDNMHAHYLGFDHMVDVLKEDLAEGRIRPEQLSKVSIEHAVRRVHEYDQERKKAMAEAQLKATEGMPVHKDYGDGFKWIELAPKKPNLEEPLPEGYEWLEPKNNLYRLRGPSILSDRGRIYLGETRQEALEQAHKRDAGLSEKIEKPLREALNYEGDTMGHCVGGYCDEVASGRKRIFSLRDAKNEPHVTIEVKPTEYAPRWEKVKPYLDVAREQVMKDRLAKGLPTTDQYENEIERLSEAYAVEMAKKDAPPSIKQIKGKQNAKPKKDYIPYVQDFVKSGNWSEVGDLQNAEMYEVHPESDVAKAMTKLGMDVPRHVTSNEMTDLLKQTNTGMYSWKKARGGRVTHVHHLEIEERPL